MGTTERRTEIMRVLCRRRHETISNLSSEFGVSKRTISRDIEILSITEPIYTISGRYGGGVYVIDNYTPNQIYMSEIELSILKKILSHLENNRTCTLNEYELNTLKTIIKHYEKPKLRKDYKND